MAMPQLKRLVAGFTSWQSGFASGQHVGFVVDKAALGVGFLRLLPFPLPIIIPPSFSIIIITRGWHNRPTGDRSAEWTQLDSTQQYSNFKK
jgi:hypothetical protein